MSSITLTAPIAYIGVAQNVQRSDVVYPFAPIDIHRLAKSRNFTIFPANLRGLVFCFLVNAGVALRGGLNGMRIVGRDEEGVDRIVIDMGFQKSDEGRINHMTSSNSDVTPTDISAGLSPDEGEWQLLPVQMTDVFITKPGKCQLFLLLDGREFPLGTITFGLAEVAPYDENFISAVKASPFSSKYIRFRIGCSACDSKMTVVAGIDRPTVDDAVWFQDCQSEWICACKKAVVDLSYIRRGLHSLLLERANLKNTSIIATSLYSQENVELVVRQYGDLLDRSPGEEVVQQFIERNPLVWAPHYPARIFVKPRILGKFVADFALLDELGVLTLVEIERPGTRLFKRNGHATADLNHAIDQVRDWIACINDHRSAVLDQLSISSDSVARVRGLVIAGRAANEKEENLKRFMKVKPNEDIDFHTFDYLGHRLRHHLESVGVFLER